jgi:hypothetical protein
MKPALPNESGRYCCCNREGLAEMSRSFVFGLPIIAVGAVLFGQTTGVAPGPRQIDRALDSLDGLVAHNVRLNATTYRDRPAVRVGNSRSGGGNAVAAVSGTTITDGTIDVDVAGQPEQGASAGARGFIGVAFRLADESHFECFYIRPTNGRADDQLRRNHATQYVSLPDFPFDRLRTESPGVYESYADLVPGEWTHLRVVVVGRTAKLYVNAATQPTLLVNDLRRLPMAGLIGLWIGDETDGYFSRLHIVEHVPKPRL